MASRIKHIRGKFYDIGTGNVSFKQLATDLRELGVKEYYFMLEIKDYSLAGVNPYQCDQKTGKSTLTEDQVRRIIAECARNPWYYLREICRIPDSGNPAGIPYNANRGNIAQTYLFLNGIDSWLCLPRQQGKTQSMIAILAWAYNFGTTDSTFIFVNKDSDGSKENLKRLQAQIELLPEYLQFMSYTDSDGKKVKAQKNATTMRQPVTNNSIKTRAKATSQETAMSLARGLTAPIIHFDEPEFTPYIFTIVSNSVSTYETAARRARENGTMYGRCFTCTPGDVDSQPGKDAEIILSKTCKWTEEFYNMSKDEIENYIEHQGEKCNRIVYIEFHYNQIGLTRRWLDHIAAEIQDKITIRREILLQRIHGSSLSPFDQEDIEYIADQEQKPIQEIYVNEYYRFDVYTQLDRKIPYLVSVDCSTGTGDDNNAITVLNPYTVKPVAEFESSFIGETEYEKLIISFVEQYVPRAVVIIERNSMGDGIIDHLLNSRIAGRLYFDKAKELLDEKMRQNETMESMLKKAAMQKKFYGVYTGEKSRKVMMSILSRHVNEMKENFVTHNIIRDLSRLVRTNSGKIEAGKGFHDDSVMSYLIGLYVFYHGNNLQMFGVEPGRYEGDDQRNQGLHVYDEEDLRSILPEEVVEGFRREEEVKQVLNYEDILRDAVASAQKDTARLMKSRTVSVTSEISPLTEFDDDDGSIDLDLFNSLNNF